MHEFRYGPVNLLWKQVTPKEHTNDCLMKNNEGNRNILLMHQGHKCPMHAQLKSKVEELDGIQGYIL